MNPPEILVQRQGGGIGGVFQRSAERYKALQAAYRATDTWRAKVSNALTATKGIHKVAEALTRVHSDACTSGGVVAVTAELRSRFAGRGPWLI